MLVDKLLIRAPRIAAEAQTVIIIQGNQPYYPQPYPYPYQHDVVYD